MGLLYKPSIFEIVAAVLFLAAALIALRDQEYLATAAWATLSLAFTVKVAPKFLILSAWGFLLQWAALIVGIALLALHVIPIVQE